MSPKERGCLSQLFEVLGLTYCFSFENFSFWKLISFFLSPFAELSLCNRLLPLYEEITMALSRELSCMSANDPIVDKGVMIVMLCCR